MMNGLVPMRQRFLNKTRCVFRAELIPVWPRIHLLKSFVHPNGSLYNTTSPKNARCARSVISKEFIHDFATLISTLIHMTGQYILRKDLSELHHNNNRPAKRNVCVFLSFSAPIGWEFSKSTNFSVNSTSHYLCRTMKWVKFLCEDPQNDTQTTRR